MGRLIGYVANRIDRLSETLHDESAALGPAQDIHADAWGIGFYQGGEVLHKKRPRSTSESSLDWEDVAGNVKTDCAVLHFRSATVGDHRAENTHPFRMRQWIFGHQGTVHGFDSLRETLLEQMPDFLRRNIRGTTDSEHIFHVLLSFLHDRGQLDNPDIEAKIVLAAMRSTISLADRLAAEIGAPEATLNMLLTNGRQMFAVRRGDPMHWVSREVGTDARRPHGSFRYVLIVSNGPEAPPDYERLESSHSLVIDRDLRVERVAL